MRIIRCDRCGKDISDYDNTGYVSVNWRPARGDDGLVVDNPFEDRDFCEDCIDEIKAFVDKKKPEDEDPEESEDEEADPEPAEQEGEEGRCFEAAPDLEPPKEYKGVNLRKLRELVKAGKTAQEIAAELGCSVATYYKHRKRAEELWNKGLL